MSILGRCLALRTTTVILCTTGWYDSDTWSSPLLMHFCKGETWVRIRAGEGGGRGRRGGGGKGEVGEGTGRDGTGDYTDLHRRGKRA